MLTFVQITVAGFILIILVVLFFFYIQSDKILHRWYNLEQVGFKDEIYKVMLNLTSRAGLDVPKLYLVDYPDPNSFSIKGKNSSSIILTTAAVDRLDHKELEALMAHEMGHIINSNRPGIFFTMAAGMLTMLSTAALWGALLTGFGQEYDPAPQLIRSYAMALVAPPAAAMIQLATPRSKEFVADAYSAGLCGAPKLIETLEYLDNYPKMLDEINPAHANLFFVNPLKSNIFNSLFNTHPPINERIKRLEEAHYAGQ
jgi:heat shock protein HtpX